MIVVIDFSSEQDKKRLFNILRQFKPIKYRIELKQHKPHRSSPQNRYYWGVIVKVLSEHTGFYPDEMHDYLKRKFMPVERTLRQTGEVITVGKSTALNDTLEQEIYHERIRRWAISDLDVYIPEPSEFLEI